MERRGYGYGGDDGQSLVWDLHDIALEIAQTGKTSCRTLDSENVALAADRLDMRGVVIVEWCAMMAGALPFGWHWVRIFGEYRAVPPGGGETFIIERNAWEAEYRHRPRLEER